MPHDRRRSCGPTKFQLLWRGRLSVLRPLSIPHAHDMACVRLDDVLTLDLDYLLSPESAASGEEKRDLLLCRLGLVDERGEFGFGEPDSFSVFFLSVIFQSHDVLVIRLRA